MPRTALLAALFLAMPAAAAGASGAARLLVSANVVRSVQVSVSGATARSASLRVRTPTGGVWSSDVARATGVPGIGLSAYAADPAYVVLTVLADAPFPPDGQLPPAR
jgi:hypothetical protein